MQKFLLIAAGLFCLIIVLIDVFKTILYINGGGRLSSFVARKIWRFYYFLAGKDGRSPILNLTGGTILIGLVLMWILMIWLGYSLIYLSDPHSVVNSNTGAQAGVIGKIYYVGYTLTSLGNGDLKSGSDVWRIVSNIMGMNSMVFISLGISYLLPVLQAVIDKRTLAVYINRLGESPQEIIEKGYNGKDFSPLYDRFQQLEEMILKHAERHLAYPILHYFHSNKTSHAVRLNLARLEEALNIQEIYKLDDSEKAYHWKILRGAMDNLSERLSESYAVEEDKPPEFNYWENLSDKLRSKVPEERHPIEIGEVINHRRSRILKFIKNDGWTWQDVVGGK